MSGKRQIRPYSPKYDPLHQYNQFMLTSLILSYPVLYVNGMLCVPKSLTDTGNPVPVKLLSDIVSATDLHLICDGCMSGENLPPSRLIVSPLHLTFGATSFEQLTRRSRPPTEGRPSRTPPECSPLEAFPPQSPRIQVSDSLEDKRVPPA